MAFPDLAAAPPVCDVHHWVSSHEPYAPIWVIQCDMCGKHDFAAMLDEHDQRIAKDALTQAAEDAEKVARLDATPFNQATNAEHSYMRYHDLNKVREEDVRTVANWLYGRAALIGAPRITASHDSEASK